MPTNRERLFPWIAAASVGVGVVATSVGSITSFLKTPSTELPLADVRIALSRQEIADIRTRIASLEHEISALSEGLKKSSAVELEKAGLSSKFEQMDTVRNELDRIKQIVVEDPTKALAIPLMRKDINDLERRQQDFALSAKEQIDRIYDFSKWFLALMITLAIGLVTLGFVRRPKEGPKEGP